MSGSVRSDGECAGVGCSDSKERTSSWPQLCSTVLYGLVSPLLSNPLNVNHEVEQMSRWEVITD